MTADTPPWKTCGCREPITGVTDPTPSTVRPSGCNNSTPDPNSTDNPGALRCLIHADPGRNAGTSIDTADVRTMERPTTDSAYVVRPPGCTRKSSA